MRLGGFLADELWRHFQLLDDGGGGGGDGGFPWDNAPAGPGRPDNYVPPQPPPPPPPPPPPYRGSSGHGRSSPPPPPPPPPNPFEGIAQLRVDQIKDLVNRWEALVGYGVTVPDWALKEMMADAGKYSTLYDISRYMKGHQGDDGAHFVPSSVDLTWAQYGMTASEYHQKLAGFDSVWQQLTGQMTAPGDLTDQALQLHQGNITQGQFDVWLLAQDSIKEKYKWLKYGLDYNQFQSRKLDMQLGFGHTLDNDEGVLQLQYLHAAAGSDKSVSLQPTWSQLQKRTAETGISGVLAR